MSNSLPTIRRKRTMTAKEIAEGLGISERTVRRRVAESRADYEERARQRREFVSQQRAERVPYATIAEQLGVSVNAAKLLGTRARKVSP